MDMKSLGKQMDIIFNVCADRDLGCFGKGITVDMVEVLFGCDAVQYATNAEGEKARKHFPYRIGNVFTKDGFDAAFHYYWMWEIFEGIHDAYTVPDYIKELEIEDYLKKGQVKK